MPITIIMKVVNRIKCLQQYLSETLYRVHIAADVLQSRQVQETMAFHQNVCYPIN